jgi:hypothetical protein
MKFGIGTRDLRERCQIVPRRNSATRTPDVIGCANGFLHSLSKTVAGFGDLGQSRTAGPHRGRLQKTIVARIRWRTRRDSLLLTFEIASEGRQRIILSAWHDRRFDSCGIRMIKKRDHSRCGWLAVLAIAGTSLLGGIAPSASASDRSTKTPKSCCKAPMRAPCSCCLPVTAPAERGPVLPSLTRRSQIASSPLARSCVCQTNEVPAPSPKRGSTDEGFRLGRDRAEPAERCASFVAHVLNSPPRARFIHSPIASPFPICLRNVRLLI